MFRYIHFRIPAVTDDLRSKIVYHTSYIVTILFLVFLLSSCRTYYYKNAKFNAYFQQGQMEQAESLLAKDKKGPKSKEKLLYFLNRGTVAFMLGKSAESNDYFEQALNLADNTSPELWQQAAALLSNNYLLPYPGESFEILMIYYYKALNYINLHQYEDALVECRRMQERLNKLSDQYKKNNHYRHDAFINNLMGVIYDADHDYNNAFISFRNAYNIYEEDYRQLYQFGAPEQLKGDLLRTAYLTGLSSEVDFYQKKFGMKYKPVASRDSGDLVFFWLNGLGPVKDQWSVDFTVIRGEGGWVTFENKELGWSFPFQLESDSKKKDGGLSDLEFFRIALPKYLERPEAYQSGMLSSGNKSAPLVLAQDVNQIAKQSLNDRTLRELGTSLLRLALKKAEEYSLRKQNKDAGAALGIVNFFTEQADTRNWQTLPHSIYYTRMRLPVGEQQVSLVETDRNGNQHKQTFTFSIRAGQTVIQSFHNVTALPAGFVELR